MIVLTVKSERRELDLPDDSPLLWARRDNIGQTGTKLGCATCNRGRRASHRVVSPAVEAT